MQKFYDKENDCTYLYVNWYAEELDKFYDEDKDNNGLIHGIYVYNGKYNPDEYQQVEDVEWFKTEEERDLSAKKLSAFNLSAKDLSAKELSDVK